MSITSYCTECGAASNSQGVLEHLKTCTASVMKSGPTTDYLRPPAITLSFDSPKEQQEFMEKLRNGSSANPEEAHTLAEEVHSLIKTYPYHQWYVVEAILQIIDREKIIVINRYRKNHDEPELVPEPQRYKGINQQHSEWVIDVPKSWYSETGKR